MSSADEEGYQSLKNNDADIVDDYEPSISDQLHSGYCRMDRACQTDVSEIVDLKRMSQALSVLVQDFSSLKKSLYYAKLELQAEYDGRLQEAVLELYARVNKRVADIKSIYKERVEVVRRSYKTQLSNAVCKLSSDYHQFYGVKDANLEASHKKKVKKMEEQQRAARKKELAQQGMFAMLQMQMQDDEPKLVPSRSSSSISVSDMHEIEGLKETVRGFETRVEYLGDMLEDKINDNVKLNAKTQEVTRRLVGEEEKTSRLLEKVSSLQNQLEQEKVHASEKLAGQKDQFQAEMENRLKMMRNKLQKDAQKEIDNNRKREAEKLQQQKLIEKQKIEELKQNNEHEKKPIEIPTDADIGRLQIIERKQRAEIARLQKELGRTIKMWEMKVKILQEHIHALKDEMFLRTILQQQPAKVTPASSTNIKKGDVVIPLGVVPASSTAVPTRPQRRYILPTVIQVPKVTEEASQYLPYESSG